MLHPTDSLSMGGVEQWNPKAHVQFQDTRYFAGLRQGMVTATVWGLQNTESANNLIKALSNNGFSSAGGNGVLGNGKKLEMNPARDDPSNPWLGPVGAATFVAAKNDTVIQASVPAIMPIFLSDSPRLSQAPVAKTALAGIKQAVGDHTVVHALLISPALGLSGVDPAQILNGKKVDLDALTDKLNELAKSTADGIPAYSGGIIADVQLDKPGMVVSLTYSNCYIATSAAQALSERWKKLMPDTAQGSMTTNTVADSDGRCAATLTVVGNARNDAKNPIFDAWYQQMMQSNFALLRIGVTQ